MIPENIKQSLDKYAKDKRPTGGFLRSVLENNLSDAVCKADMFNLSILKNIVLYVNNDMPSPCWGSPKKVKEWLASRTESESGK